MKKIATTALISALQIYSMQLFAASESTTNCVALQSSSWAEQEQWVWEKLCKREVADLDERAGLKERESPWETSRGEWAQDRIIGSSFLYDIFLNEPYRSALEHKSIEIIGAWYVDPITFSGAKITNNVMLGGSVFEKPFTFRLGTTEARFWISNSWIKEDFRFNFSFAGTVALSVNRFDASVSLAELKSTGSVVLLSNFNDYLNLSGLRAGELVFGSGEVAASWQEQSQVSLRGAQVERLVDLESSWEGLKGKLDLQGFSYNQLGGMADSFDSAANAGTGAERDLDQLLTWLELQESREEIFLPQPYEQLASVLYNVGQRDKADQILYQMNEYRRLHVTTGFGEKTWLTIKKIVIGYGYQIWLTILWLIGLIGFGAFLMFRSTLGRSLGVGRCCLYSLDQAIPLIDLDPKHQDLARKQLDSFDYYFKIQQILSLVLISFLGAGLAGAIG